MPTSARSSLLSRKEVAKPWGVDSLPNPFTSNPGERIGEIWFEHDGALLDLMVKYLFTSEALSIQVHPDDQQAEAVGLSSGKEECWLVLDAVPGSVLGIGTKRALSASELRGAALDGTIEQLMDWKPVSRGDFYYIPAGTVHAIGAGVTLVEIQQNADITYRLYDYGRPRELHLEDGVGAARPQPYPAQLGAKVALDTPRQLVKGPKFNLWLDVKWPSGVAVDQPAYLVPLQGHARVDGIDCSPGTCMLCGPGCEVSLDDDFTGLIAQASTA